jgi:hypothetical protein
MFISWPETGDQPIRPAKAAGDEYFQLKVEIHRNLSYKERVRIDKKCTSHTNGGNDDNPEDVPL